MGLDSLDVVRRASAPLLLVCAGLLAGGCELLTAPTGGATTGGILGGGSAEGGPPGPLPALDGAVLEDAAPLAADADAGRPPVDATVAAPPDSAAHAPDAAPDEDAGLCALIDCVPGHACVETAQGATCEPVDGGAGPSDPCASVTCLGSARCEVVGLLALCLPPASSCAAALCPADTYCDDIGGQVRCIPLPSCANVQCEAGSHCELQEVQCVRAPCPAQPSCVPDTDPTPSPDPCATVRCSLGYHCEAVNVQCIRAPCPAIGQCVQNGSGLRTDQSAAL